VASGVPLISTSDAVTKLLPFTVRETLSCTCAKVIVLGESDPISGTGRALPQRGFSVLFQPGRNNTRETTARQTTDAREDMAELLER
jgi:hypothetical protein